VSQLFLIFREGISILLGIVVAREYVPLFAIVAIEEAGVPLPAPSDIVIMFYGDRARGDLAALALVVLICAAASTFGTLVPYMVTRRYGQPAAHRIARWIDVDDKQIDRWTTLIARHGFIAIFIGRLIPGLRVAMSLIGGTAKVPLYEFSAGVFGAGLLYWSVWTALGALAGPAIRRFIPRAYIEYIVLGIPIVVVSYLVFRYVRGRRRHARATGAG
jgi:membrane-associated protein